METGDLVPRGEINGALGRRILNFVDASAKMQPIDPRQKAADAIDLPYLEKISNSEEFKSYLAELGTGAKDDAEEDSDEQTENEVKQLEPRASTGIINYQPVGDPVLVATGGTDVDIACSNGADTCLATWYGGGNIHTQPFNTSDLTKPLRNETAFSGCEWEFSSIDLSNGGYGLAYYMLDGGGWVHLRAKMLNMDGAEIRQIYLGQVGTWDVTFKPSLASYTFGFTIESYLYYERNRNMMPIENDGTEDEIITVNSGYNRQGALSSRGNVIADVFDTGSNTLMGKFIHADTRILSNGYTLSLDPQFALGTSQSVAFGNMDEFLVATDGIEGTESKIYVLSGDTNSTFFNNCNYRGPYVMPNINMGPVEITYIGHDSEHRSLYDVTFRDISSNAVGSRCWYDKDLEQPQCSSIETITSIPNVRKTSTAVTQDGEVVRGFRTSADEIWLQKYTCSPVPCAKTPDDVPSYPSGWSDSNQKLSEELSSTTDPNGSKVGAIVGSLLGTLGLFCVAGGAVYGVRRYRRNKSKMPIELTQILSETKVNPDRVKEGELLGKGAYGKVYSGLYEHLKVAIKMINYEFIDAENIGNFMREIEVMKDLQHPNVVQLIGACQKEYSEEGTVLCIVMELMNGGTLKDVDKNTPLSTNIGYAMDIALALRDMHNRNILHRDIKPDNVFLNEKMDTAKLGDFGVSKVVMPDQQQTLLPTGTPIYMAPELINPKKGADRSATKASDVYSFGMLLYEVITGKEPYRDCKDQFEIYGAKDRGELPKIPNNCPQVIANLITQCCAKNKNDRPSMAQVYDSLANYHKKLNADANVGVQQTNVTSLQHGF